MSKKYYRLDSWSFERFRLIESHGAVWEIDHYFLPREELPEWLKKDPPLDMSALDLRFAEKPKAKKVTQLIMSAGKIYVNADVYEKLFRDMVSEVVTLMPLKISEVSHYFLRPEVVIDCVDEQRSEWRQRDDGFRYTWPSLVLKDVPKNAPDMFRPGIGREFWKQVVFSSNFVEVCQKNRVIGAVFEEVYPLADD